MMFTNKSFLPGVLLALTCLAGLISPARAAGGVVNGIRADEIVAQDGSGDFKTVQAAFDAVPRGNAKPFVIYIKPGTYKEKMHLDADQPFVRLIGQSPDTTLLTYGDYARMKGPDGQEIGTGKTFSVMFKGHDLTAENLSFENSAAPRSVVGQAVAVLVEGDRSVFRNCHFLANQDTLYANHGRQYYQNCLIKGDVDFIFGNAPAVFDHCEIQSVGKGYITAVSRTDASQPTGYVFLGCTLTGTAPAGSVALGRPWRPYARAVFLDCTLGPDIEAQGWNDWSAGDADREKTVFYAERGSKTPDGKPADTSQRVAWSHQLTADEAKPFLPTNFLKGDDGWNPASAGSGQKAVK